MEFLLNSLQEVAELGGPVVLILIALSVVSLAVVIYKAVQFLLAGVGRHKRAFEAIEHVSSGGDLKTLADLQGRKTLLECVVLDTIEARQLTRQNTNAMSQVENSLFVETDYRLTKLEKGFRILDSIAQVAPLLGLFGTVLGMIEAFQRLQSAGSSVDPTILAGGIWVALLTTAVGLAVAMPTSLFLTFFESRVAREREACELVISRGMSGHQLHTNSKAPTAAADADEFAKPATA